MEQILQTLKSGDNILVKSLTLRTSDNLIDLGSGIQL